MRDPTALQLQETVNVPQGCGCVRKDSACMLGLDVSKASVAATLLDTDQRLRWERTVPNNPVGIAMLLRETPPDHPWVMEPTGSYSSPIARQAVDAGRCVLMAPPRQAQAFLRSVQPRAKTDRLDSRGLARYACAIPLHPYPLKSAVMEALDQLLAARQGLARSLARLKQQRATLPAAASVLSFAIDALEAQQKVLNHQIAAQTRIAHLPGVATLDRVPGIGPVLATAAAACLHAKAFSHPDRFVAYIGLDVRVRQSGTRQGQQALSKHGHAELRRLFYLAAQANLRTKDPLNPFKLQYARERTKGLSSTAALNAVARKLARLCWSLMHHRTEYSPNRVYTQIHPPESLDIQP